jgi:2,4-dienoyl-CoA reductase-like NADH-dependent reductase (Old Yellow Enzyme family)
MARYFHFRTLDDIRAECERLGLTMRFQEDLSPLFEPWQLGNLRVGNRLCIQPMEGCDGTLEGRPDELTLRRYQRFGAGGAKLIWGEAAAVVPEGRANPRQLLINDHNATSIEQMLRICRQAHRDACGTDRDLVVGLQLTHSGRYSFQRPLLACHDPLLDPLTVVDKHSGKRVDAGYPLLSDDDLKQLEDHYVVAARLAFKLGFDFVDLKQCHRYLLNELLSAKTRPGPYGGCFENRTRLPRDILLRVRSEVPGAVIATRLNLFDGVPFAAPSLPGGCLSAWGTNEENPAEPDLSEPRRWIAEMQELGVAMVNASMGNPYASPHVIRPYETPPPDGYEPPEHPLVGVDRHFRLTAEMQRAFPTLPLVGSGYSWLQEFLFDAGAANLADRRCTFVGVGRASLAQPDFARQLLEHGRLDRKRICRTFSYCTALMRAKHNELGQFPTGCPPFDKNVYGAIWREASGQ